MHLPAHSSRLTNSALAAKLIIHFGGASLCFALAVLPFSYTGAWRFSFLGLAFVASVIGVLLVKRNARHPLPSMPRSIGVLWLLWVFWAGASVINSAQYVHSLKDFKLEVVFGLAGFLTAFILAPHCWPWCRRFVALSICAVAIAIQVKTPASELFFNTRFSGPGFVTTFLIIGTPWLALLWPRCVEHPVTERWDHMLLGGALLSAINVAYASQNRMVWLAWIAQFAVGVCLLPVMGYLGKRRAWVTIVGIVCVIGAALAFNKINDTRLDARMRAAPLAPALAIDERPMLWRYAIARIAERPMLGYGLGKTILADEFRAQFAWHPNAALLLHAHNFLLNRALQSGLPGLAILVASLIAMAYLCLKTLLNPAAQPLQNRAAAGLLIMLVGFILKNMTDDFFVGYNALFFWVTAGSFLGMMQAPAANPNA